MRGYRLQTAETGRVSLCGVIVCCACVVVVALIMFPVFVRTGCGGCSQKSNCQSNMKQMGSAFKLYLQDWHDTYPTNRPRLASGKLGPISSYVKLTPASELIPPRQPRNLSWVEALYPYMEPPSDVGGNKVECGAWECRAASTDCYPTNSKTAYTTYVMNRNLVERPEQCIRESDRLMLAREANRHVNAELRPTNYSCGRPDVPPESPFLTGRDSRLGRTKSELHANGSHILFADSHVKFFPAEAFPDHITKARCWDVKDRQWYNYAHGKGVSPALRETIAITP